MKSMKSMKSIDFNKFLKKDFKRNLKGKKNRNLMKSMKSMKSIDFNNFLKRNLKGI